MTQPDDLVDSIRRAQLDGRWEQIESLVRDMPTPISVDLATRLLNTLSDTAEHEPQAFAIVHAAEAIDDVDYARCLLTVLPSLQPTSPRWSRTLLARVINSPSTFDALLSAV